MIQANRIVVIFHHATYWYSEIGSKSFGGHEENLSGMYLYPVPLGRITLKT